MGKNFEIYAIVKEPIAFDTVVSAFADHGARITEIKRVDDWSYSDERTLDIGCSDLLAATVEQNKILIVNGEIEQRHCGCFISKLKSAEYEYDFWFSIDYYSELNVDCITENNKAVYSAVLDEVRRLGLWKNLVALAIGLEMSISGGDPNSMIAQSSGVVRWVFPQTAAISLNDYDKELIDDAQVFSTYGGKPEAYFCGSKHKEIEVFGTGEELASFGAKLIEFALGGDCQTSFTAGKDFMARSVSIRVVKQLEENGNNAEFDPKAFDYNKFLEQENLEFTQSEVRCNDPSKKEVEIRGDKFGLLYLGARVSEFAEDEDERGELNFDTGVDLTDKSIALRFFFKNVLRH